MIQITIVNLHDLDQTTSLSYLVLKWISLLTILTWNPWRPCHRVTFWHLWGKMRTYFLWALWKMQLVGMPRVVIFKHFYLRIEWNNFRKYFYLQPLASLDAGSRKSVAMGSLKLSGKIKRVLSAPKSLSTRRKSLSGIFKSRPKNPSENGEFDSLSSSFNSLNFVDKYQRQRTSRIRSISDNYPVITHPHDYGGITKITRSSQTCSDLDLPSKNDKITKETRDAVTQTQELTRKVNLGGRPRILTNPRCHPWHPWLLQTLHHDILIPFSSFYFSSTVWKLRKFTR